MALARGKIQDIAYIPTTVGSLYANPAATKTYIRGIVIYNGHTAAELVKLYNVPDAAAALGTPGDANQFFEQSIPSKETFTFTVPGSPLVLVDQNDAIFGICVTASKVTVQFTGDKDA